MSTLQYVVRPKIYCMKCGGCCEQSLHPHDVTLRTIVCKQQDCAQFNREVVISDPVITLFERPDGMLTDLHVDMHGNH